MRLTALFLIFTFSLGLITSCSSTGIKEGLKRRKIDDFYTSSGVVTYFLADLPDWANASATASCHRNTSVRYLNLAELRPSFGLSYEEAVQFQYMYNVDYQKKRQEFASNYLLFKDEEKLFYDVSDKIQAGIRSFQKPKFDRINLVWIDPVLWSKNLKSKVQRLMKSKAMKKGHPVFVSLCMSHSELQSFIKENGWQSIGVRGLPFEVFSPFDKEGKATHGLIVEVDQLFDKKQKIYFYTPKNNKPTEIRGKFILRNY